MAISGGQMNSQAWSDQFLDQMRQVGDPAADEVMDALFANGEIGAVNQLMRTLILNDGIPSAGLPREVSDYLARSSDLPPLAQEHIRRGEEVFARLGPEILLVLGFYALPADYAAKKGVQALYRTGRLVSNPIRRVFETTQMVVDVMSPGGLAPNGRGVRSAQKVRLMHAAVRHMLRHDEKLPWDSALGTPINQEDLAGTLMSFAYLVPEGLTRLGIELEQADMEAYYRAWTVVGRIMGIRDELIPQDLAAAHTLTSIIHRRQIAQSAEGSALAAALIEGYQKLLIAPLHGVPASMIRFFLNRDPFSGQNVADMLGVPPADWARDAIEVAAHLDRLLGPIHIGHALVDRAIGYVSRQLVEGMLLVERGGKRAPFFIPDTLSDRWGTSSARAAE